MSEVDNVLIGWLKEIEEGRFETEIIPLLLEGSFGKHLSGQGKLTWSADDIGIEAITDGGEALFHDLMSGISVKPGQLLPANYYFRLIGTTRDGWDVEIDRLDSQTHSTVAGHPTAVWKLNRQEIGSWIHFRRANSSERMVGVSEALFRPSALPGWPRKSETKYDNPHFGMTGSKLDWLEYECAIGKVAAQSRESGLIRLRIEHGADFHPSQIDAIRMALSYLCGRMVSLVAAESWNADYQTRTLPTSEFRKRNNRFRSPLGQDGNAVLFYESFLKCMSDLLVTPNGQHIANLIYACMDSVDSTFTTSAMVLCSTVEALVEPYAKAAPREHVLTATQKKQAIQLLEDNGFPAAALARIPGLLGMMDQLSVKAVLRAWADQSLIGITMEDVKAWSHLRNRAMHGRLLMEDEDLERKQQDVSAAQRTANLINKLILNEAGYRGKYFDYSSWDHIDFVPASLTLGTPQEDVAHYPSGPRTTGLVVASTARKS